MNPTEHSVLLISDWHGSVLGNAWQRSYAPFGFEKVGHRASGILAFNGQRPEHLARHYLLGDGYRAYNAVLMRFHSPDSVSPFGTGGVNSYVYGLADPINRLDPTGHAPLFFRFIRVIKKAFPAKKTIKIDSLELTNITKLARTIKANPDVHKIQYFPTSEPPSLQALAMHEITVSSPKQLARVPPGLKTTLPNYAIKEGPLHNILMNTYLTAPNTRNGQLAHSILSSAYTSHAGVSFNIKEPAMSLAPHFNALYYTPESIKGYGSDPILMDAIKAVRGK